MARLTRAELLEILEGVYATDPDEPVAPGEFRCHYCLNETGEPHAEECLWLIIAAVTGNGEEASARLVGEDAEALDERLEAADHGDVVFSAQPTERELTEVCDQAVAALQGGALLPWDFEPVRQAARIVEPEGEDDE